MGMLFLICFNYNLLRNIKDAVVVTARDSGAEVIPFIKVWVLLPLAVLATLLFTKWESRYSRQKLFYLTISCFLIFFALFSFVLYPLRDSLHPHALADQLTAVLPLGLKGFIAMIRNWTFTLFYVGCELWGSMVLSVLFWGLANEITQMSQARRFYGTLGVVASCSTIFSGMLGNAMTDGESWDTTLHTLTAAILVSGIAIMAIFRGMSHHMQDERQWGASENTSRPEQENTLSLSESFAYLAKSRYLICIAILVVCYNLVINLVEIVWKDQLRQLCPSTVDYSRYMNSLTLAIGIVATLTSLFTSFLVTRFGWSATALITPLAMLVTGTGFFSFMLMGHTFSDWVVALTGMTPLALSVLFGAAQVCLSKACKYSIFDTTKEMAFIPLNRDYRMRGKAAIDGVGSRFGKSGGSFIHQALLMVFGSISMSAPYVAALLFIVVSGWTVAVRTLGRQFGEMVAAQEGEVPSPLDAEPLRTDKLSVNSLAPAEA